jgi:hypothetical protein
MKRKVIGQMNFSNNSHLVKFVRVHKPRVKLTSLFWVQPSPESNVIFDDVPNCDVD